MSLLLKILRILETAMPALAAFGPVFLVAQPRRPEWARAVQLAGILMVSTAMLLMWFTITAQSDELSLLQQRVELLETRSR